MFSYQKLETEYKNFVTVFIFHVGRLQILMKKKRGCQFTWEAKSSILKILKSSTVCVWWGEEMRDFFHERNF